MNKEKIKRLVTLESESSWKLLFYPGRWILLLLTMVPTIYAFWLSIQNYNLAKPTQRSFVLLRNYLNVVTDSRFLGALGTTAKFTVCSLALELVDCPLSCQEDLWERDCTDYHYASDDHDAGCSRADLENVL